MTPTLNARPGLPLAATASNLGPLADLAGTWVGTGFNLISLPDFSSVPPGTGPKDFRLKLNATIETLQVHSDRRSRSEPRRGLCAGQPHRPARHLDLRTNLSAAGQRPGHQRSPAYRTGHLDQCPADDRPAAGHRRDGGANGYDSSLRLHTGAEHAHPYRSHPEHCTCKFQTRCGRW